MCPGSAAEAASVSVLLKSLASLCPPAAAMVLFATFILAFLILFPQGDLIEFVTGPDSTCL